MQPGKTLRAQGSRSTLTSGLCLPWGWGGGMIWPDLSSRPGMESWRRASICFLSCYASIYSRPAWLWLASGFNVMQIVAGRGSSWSRVLATGIKLKEPSSFTTGLMSRLLVQKPVPSAQAWGLDYQYITFSVTCTIMYYSITKYLKRNKNRILLWYCLRNQTAGLSDFKKPRLRRSLKASNDYLALFRTAVLSVLQHIVNKVEFSCCLIFTRRVQQLMINPEKQLKKHCPSLRGPRWGAHKGSVVSDKCVHSTNCNTVVAHGPTSLFGNCKSVYNNN